MQHRILFIAYFYPPVSGTGFPGAKRMTNFVKYLQVKHAHVLTLRLKDYPRYFDLQNETQLPVSAEIIHRTGTLDFFKLLLKLKNRFKKVAPHSDNDSATDNKKNRHGYGINQKKRTPVLDEISSILTYPDFAYPWMLPACIQGLKIIKKHNIDLIFATGMPWTALLVGAILNLLTGKKFIADFRDPWVGNPFLTNKTKLQKFLDEKAESFVVRRANKVIANTEMLKSEFVTRYPRNNNFLHLPNGYDPDDFKDLPTIKLPKNKLIITHAGFLYLKRDPIALLKAFEYIKTHYPDDFPRIEFRQIGKVQLDYDIEVYCKKKGIEKNVKIIQPLPHKQCLGYLAASDILLIIQPDTKNQIPSKLFEYFYLKKTIIAIAPAKSSLENLIKHLSFGHLVEPGETDHIAEIIIKMNQRKKLNLCSETFRLQPSDFDIKQIIANFVNQFDV